MIIDDNAFSSGNGRPVLPSRLRGQRLDQARETDKLDLRNIVASSEAPVHVMGDRVVFPSGWGSAVILSSLGDAI
jgi:hypothetical protein